MRPSSGQALERESPKPSTFSPLRTSARDHATGVNEWKASEAAPKQPRCHEGRQPTLLLWVALYDIGSEFRVLVANLSDLFVISPLARGLRLFNTHIDISRNACVLRRPFERGRRLPDRDDLATRLRKDWTDRQ